MSGDVMARLERLERQNRWLKLAGFVALVGIGAVMLMGQARPTGKVLEAEKIVLRDASGALRVTLAADDGQGVASLMLVDRDKAATLLSMMASGHSLLELFGRGGKGGANLRVLADGTPRLILHDPNKKMLFQAP